MNNLRLLKWIVGSLLLILLPGLFTGFFASKSYQLNQEIEIESTRQNVWMVIGDLSLWGEWFPWTSGLTSYVVSGSEQNQAADWALHDDGRKGTITISRFEPFSRICVTITIRKSGEAKAVVKDCFSIQPHRNVTRLVWESNGLYKSFWSRAFSPITKFLIKKSHEGALEKIRFIAEHAE